MECNKLNIRELIERTLHGDQYAFTQLIANHYPRFFAWVHRYERNEENCKDIIQEASFELYKELPKLQDHDKFIPWAHTIFKRAAIRFILKNKRERMKFQTVIDMVNWLKGEFSREPEIKSGLTESEFREYLMEALVKLPKPYEDVAILHYLDGLTAKEIAEKLNLTESCAEKRLTRTREKLQRILKELME